MHRTIRIAAAAAAAAGLLAFGAAAAAEDRSRGGDQAAFDAIREAQEAAWIAEDGAAFAATFHEDGDVVAFNGDHMSGREDIAEGMRTTSTGTSRARGCTCSPSRCGTWSRTWSSSCARAA